MNKIGIAWRISYIVTTFLIFVIFAFFGLPDKGVIAAFSFAAVALAFGIRGDARGAVWFYPLMVFWIVAHLVAVALFGGKINIHPTVLVTPIAVADFIVVLISIFVLERLALSR